MHSANIFNLQKFSIHDGPGIRTVVFFKGCPLKCLWCANPESQKLTPQLSLIKNNCIGCGACVAVCPNNAVAIGEDGITIDRSLCANCGACAEECYSRTIKIMGKEMTTQEVFDEVAKDEVFYRNSGGGVTFSGGEPLVYGDFCIELAEMCKDAGYHTAIETSGYGNTELFKRLTKKLDLIFFDIKHMDDQKHIELTGVSNELILDNIRAIQENAREVIVRTPMIPGLNDDNENIKATVELCLELDKVKSWEILPYHRLGEHKYESLGEGYSLEEVVPPSREKILEYAETANLIMQKEGKECVVNKSAIG